LPTERFLNFGLLHEKLRIPKQRSQPDRASERGPGDVERWQLAALDCQRDAEIAGKNIGVIVAFMAADTSGARPISQDRPARTSAAGDPRTSPPPQQTPRGRMPGWWRSSVFSTMCRTGLLYSEP
jgi:hypothetical protein